MEGALFRLAVDSISRLPSLVPSVAQVAGDIPFAGPFRTADPPQSALPNSSPPAEGEKVAYLVALAVLLALLAFTIWRELRPALRAGLR